MFLLMRDLFRRRTRLERLTQQYTRLMKRSYEKALHDREESIRLKERAYRIYEEIKELNYSLADM
jgi:hypothetical protein